MRFKLLIIWYLIVGFIFRPRSSKSLNAHRKRRLSRLLQWLNQNSQFYTRYKSLHEFPVIEKKDLMENFDDINTASISREEALNVARRAEKTRDFSPMIGNITVGLSSGTSGNVGIFLVSARERAKWVAEIILRVIGFSLKTRKVAFFLRADSNLYQSVNSKLLRFKFFDLSQNMKELLQQLEEFQPDILVAQPSVLNRIADECLAKKIMINPSKILSVAEVLEEDIEKKLTNTWNQRIHQVYQCTEGFLGQTCSEGTFHLNEDLIHIERDWLDAEKTRFHPIITDTFRRTLPIVRYRLNDILHIKNERCSCGSPLGAIKKIEGRADDCFTFESNTQKIVILPDFIRRTMIKNQEINEYKVIQENQSLITIKMDPFLESLTPMIEVQFNEMLQSFGVQKTISIQFSELGSSDFTKKHRRVYSKL
ncbi:MAG: hypothetical protein MRY83_10055 [Flavobacteriales bacterium]|nr:hypothetical protein [Flavobacteriales bacterium]